MSTRTAPLRTPTDLGQNAKQDISAALNGAARRHLRPLSEDQELPLAHVRPAFPRLSPAARRAGDQIFAMTDAIAERARKLGGTTIRSIGDIARLQRIADNDAEFVTPQDMIAELASDNRQLIGFCAPPMASRRAQRRRHHQHDRELDRRGRAARLVPVRDQPQGLKQKAGARAWAGCRAPSLGHETAGA